MNKPEQKLNREIHSVCAPKIYNINKKTATGWERQVVLECLGFLSLLNYSVLTVSEIKDLWEKSGLKFL